MHIISMNRESVRSQRWEQVWPAQAIGVIATGQLLLTFAIIGLETWSMLVSLKLAFLCIGYIAIIFFAITWISTYTVVCCNRESQGCAVHALIENILSAAAASVLLYYDVEFLENPSTCFWPGRMCYDTDWSSISISWWKNHDIDIHTVKLMAIKAQLSCTTIMLALCLSFILIYIYTSFTTRTRMTIIAPQNTIEFVPQQPLGPPAVPAWAIQMPVWSPSTNE